MSQISEAAKSYIADSDLNTAAEVAMHLGQPLLLTGEPGTGKTSFAEYLAEVLAPRFFQCGPLPLHRFETKSTSSAADLFYRFDSLKRLQSTRVEGMSQDNRDYISFQALGLAILESLPWSEVDDLLPDRADHPPVPTRSVVLIDEVDKAPRDFPNDILNEIDRMFFRIPEVPPRATAAGLPASRSHSRDVHANKKLRPVVILTSNREKNLPDAFLRRCIFHNIVFPDRRSNESNNRMADIVVANLGAPSRELVHDALEFFYDVREKGGLERAPATAELVQWIKSLEYRFARLQETGKWSGVAPARITQLPQDELLATLGVLGKKAHDLGQLRKLVEARYAGPNR